MKKLILLMMLTAILSSCALFRPHKQDVEQGNIITSSEVQRLHLGMSESAVRDVMGDPVALNLFADNRLNYIYTMQRGYSSTTNKRVVCVFSSGRLVDIQHN